MSATVQDAFDEVPASVASLPCTKWRPVVGFEGIYEVSSAGCVRSLPRTRTSDGAALSGRELHPVPRKGYLRVGLWRDGVETQREVHVLVAVAFLGPRPAGQQVRHLNDVKTDNRVENLAYGTAGDNLHDAVRNGVHYWARRDSCENGHAYTPDNVRTIPSRPGVRYCRACHRENSRRARAGVAMNRRGPLPRGMTSRPLPPEHTPA